MAKPVKTKAKKSVKSASSVLRDLLNIAPTNEKDMDMFNATAVREVLALHKIDKVDVGYDGSGDSGSIESVEFSKNGKVITLLGVTVEVWEKVSNYSSENNTYATNFISSEMQISEAFERLAENVLDRRGIDWYNNDGGFGNITFSVNENTVSLDHSQRVSSTEEFSDTESWGE